MTKYDRGTLGWLKEQAKIHGFGYNIREYTVWARKNGELPTEIQVKDRWARERGYKNYMEYQNHLVNERGFKDNKEYRDHLAVEKGFSNRTDYENHLSQIKGFKNKYDEFLSKRGFKDEKEYRDSIAQEKGFKNNKEYRDKLAQKQGYKNFSEYKKVLSWDRGDYSPMFENKDCSAYLGIHIVEEKIAKIILETIFEHVNTMPNNNPGFDFICKNARQEFIDKYSQFRLERNKEYKIDSKSITVDSLDKLQFAIRYNDIPDYFLSVGFNNRENLDISGIWLIKSDEQIRINRDPWSKVDFWDRKTFTITNRPEYLFEFQQYELVCKVGKERIENIRNDTI